LSQLSDLILALISYVTVVGFLESEFLTACLPSSRIFV